MPAAVPTARIEARVPRRRWLRRVIIWAIVAAVLVGALFGGRAWLHTQYFIGVDNGHAAIYQGVPYRIGPLNLNNVAQTSDVNVSDLPTYYAEQVQTGRIRPSSMENAQQSLDELKAQADACVAARGNPANAPGGLDCP